MTEENHNQLLLAHADFLFPYAITLTHNGEEAKDLMQDTIFRALSNLDKFDETTNLKAWMYTIMKNIFINKYRRKQKESQIVNETREKMDQSVSMTGPVREDFGIVAKEIMACVERLPDPLKSPFLMHFEGYRYKEIAISLGEPLGTVKSRIHLARRLLQNMLPGYSY